MNLILFGFKGCGKTLFGKKLAHILKRPFIDLDELYDEPPSALYLKLGEKAFRNLETQILFSLKPNDPSVIALGGGTVLQSKNVLFLQTLGTLIYLERSFESVARDLKKLPAFAKDLAHLRAIYNQRKPIYESIPAFCINLDNHGL
jgi:shikimate kinase